MGGSGGIVEVDETYIGNDPKWNRYHTGKRGPQQKMKVLSLVDRSTGRAKSIVMDHFSAKAILPILQENIDAEARIMTDDAGHHHRLAADFAGHYYVNHSAGEYGRGEVHTNTIEGFFSIFKRGMRGVYQHCDRKHLHRYMAEFDFRYSNRVALGVNDVARADAALAGIVGNA